MILLDVANQYYDILRIILTIGGIYFIVVSWIYHRHKITSEGKSHMSIINIVVFLICMFLFICIWFPTYIVGMGISGMNADIAMHYHSLITNLIIGFSTVVGLALTLIWKFIDKDEIKIAKGSETKVRKHRRFLKNRNMIFFLGFWFYR